jgi:hypothetical protein
MPGRWVRGEGKKCDQGGPPGKQLHCRVFTTFRILEISYISNVFLGFVCHSKMAPISRNYTKFFLPFFYANLYKIPGILRNSVTFYTNFSTIHHIRHILHTAEKLRTPLNTPPPHLSPEPAGGIGGGVAGISSYVK